MARKPRSQRFRPLQRLADSKADAAAQALGRARRQLAEAEQRLLELRRFREEYCRQLQDHGAAGIDGRRLRAFHQFLAQLDTAIDQQQEVIARCQVTCAEETQRWQSCHREQRIMDRTIARFRREEQKQARRREQRQEDELTATRHLHRKS